MTLCLGRRKKQSRKRERMKARKGNRRANAFDRTRFQTTPNQGLLFPFRAFAMERGLDIAMSRVYFASAKMSALKADASLPAKFRRLLASFPVAVSFNEDKFTIFMHHCRYCMHCVTACPVEAITINEGSMRTFQAGMARVTKACLDMFEPDRVLHINYVLNVTPFCDCWGFTSPIIVPDVGVIASTDMVATEQASLDMVRTEDFIPDSLPPPYTVRDVDGHLFMKIHGKDPYLQVEEAEKVGLGEREYEIEEVE